MKYKLKAPARPLRTRRDVVSPSM